MFCNYISLHFNQILSSLSLHFFPFPPYVTLPNSHPSGNLRVFFSVQGSPSAASIFFFFVLVCAPTVQAVVLHTECWFELKSWGGEKALMTESLELIQALMLKNVYESTQQKFCFPFQEWLRIYTKPSKNSSIKVPLLASLNLILCYNWVSLSRGWMPGLLTSSAVPNKP